jgi:hypothetical protein
MNKLSSKILEMTQILRFSIFYFRRPLKILFLCFCALSAVKVCLNMITIDVTSSLLLSDLNGPDFLIELYIFWLM